MEVWDCQFAEEVHQGQSAKNYLEQLEKEV